MRPVPGIDGGIADALGDVAAVRHYHLAVGAVRRLRTRGQMHGRRIPEIFQRHLALNGLASHRIEAAHHTGLVGGVHRHRGMQFVRLGLGHTARAHAQGGVADIIRLPVERAGLVQPIENPAPGKRPLHRAVVDDARCGQYFDVGTQLRVADLGPGPGGSRARDEP